MKGDEKNQKNLGRDGEKVKNYNNVRESFDIEVGEARKEGRWKDGEERNGKQTKE